MNLGRLAGLRLHPSRVVRQGAQPPLREMSSAVTLKNGRPALRAVCSLCGTGKYRIGSAG